MLGKRLDRFAVRGLLAAGYYLFFLNAGSAIPLACAAAFACCLLTERATAGLRRGRRLSPAQARAELVRLAELQDEQAQRALEDLVRARYRDEDFRLTPVLKHPEAALSSGDVMNAWKANRDATRLVIAATCPCEPRAALFAQELQSPAVAVVDGRKLLRLIRTSPERIPEPEVLPLGKRLRGALARAAARRVRPRDALIAVLLLAVYLSGGGSAYLISALALVLHLCASLSRNRPQRRLFA